MQIIDSPTVFSLYEYEEKIFENLDVEIANKIQETGIVDLSRKVSGEFLIKANSKVGFIAVRGIQVNVMPRFPVYNIFYFLNLLDELKLDKEEVIIEDSKDFLTILFQSFLKSVNAATRRGLISGYVAKEDSLQVLRGRVNFSRQFNRYPGSYFPFEVTYDDFIQDIPENQILKKALRMSLRYGLRDRNLRNQAQNLLFNFREVSDLQQTPSWTRSRLNSHYWNAMRLAELIIKGKGFEENSGDVQISGFSIDMYQVFQDFVAKQLASRINGHNDLISYGGNRNKLWLDTRKLYFENPDVIWFRNSKPFQVIDTKYKHPGVNDKLDGSIDDLRQVISYASLLGLQKAHLIYGVAGAARSIETNHGAITVCAHFIDLGLAPSEINRQLNDLSLELAKGD